MPLERSIGRMRKRKSGKLLAWNSIRSRLILRPATEMLMVVYLAR